MNDAPPMPPSSVPHTIANGIRRTAQMALGALFIRPDVQRGNRRGRRALAAAARAGTGTTAGQQFHKRVSKRRAKKGYR